MCVRLHWAIDSYMMGASKEDLARIKNSSRNGSLKLLPAFIISPLLTKIKVIGRDNTIKLLEFDSFGSCVRILGFIKDISKSRINSWTPIGNGVAAYKADNLQNFSHFLLEA